MKKEDSAMKKPIGAKPGDLRRQNYQAILQLFRDKDQLAVRDIMEVVSLSKTAITNILTNLIEMDTIHSIGKGDSTTQGGKKPELYALNPNYRYSMTVFFSQHSCFCQIYNLNYNCIAELYQKSESGTEYTYPEALSVMVAQIQTLLAQTRLTEDQLCGIVFHCPGIVLSQEGIISRPILDPGWPSNLHVIKDLRRLLPFSVPFYLDNSSRYYGYYELLNHPIRRTQNIVTIFSSTTVGGSNIRMGHLNHGLTGLVGEYGHITTDYTFARRCKCGNYGCFETGVGTDYVIPRIQKELKLHTQSLLKQDISSLTMHDIFLAANAGDHFAQKQLDFVIQQFSILLYNLQIAYDPNEIIIQGEYAESEGYFQDNLRKTIQMLSLHNIQNEVKLTFSFSGRGSTPEFCLPYAMMGASLFCFDRYFSQLDFHL